MAITRQMIYIKVSICIPIICPVYTEPTKNRTISTNNFIFSFK